MIVTVGTSLFHSASWEPEGALEKVRGYELWTEEPYVGSPQRRASLCTGNDSGEQIKQDVEDLLREGPNDLVVSDAGATCAGRYSAEVTTLLQLHQEEAPDRSFSEFLQGYGDIRLVASADPGEPSHLAAKHLQAILKHLAQVSCSLQGLSGTSLPERLESFIAYLQGLPRDQRIDLVVSGGYKAFATIAGRFLPGRPQCRTIYLHEEAATPVIEDHRGLRVDNRAIEVEPDDPGWYS